jgi:4-hydroxy-3-polyprenylbenzoate decarboxylase
MGYRNLASCVADLEKAGHLVRLDEEISPHLEAAEVHRRVFRSGGPAVLFARVKGSTFPMVSNLFGTLERARFMFRDTLESVRRLIELKVDANHFWQRPGRYWKTPLTALTMLPKRVRRGPVLARRGTISQLPQLVSWPRDGGAFITLPLVYTEDAERPGVMHSNLGMYRIQISGGQYEPDREIGLHYQIHRGIGVHQAAAARCGQPLRVNVFVGGAPAMMLAAVMPLPEGMSELTFAGALAGHRIAMIDSRPRAHGRRASSVKVLGIELDRPDPAPPVPRKSESILPIYAEADFCISGTVVEGKLLPEGPFGDHLGYYSLSHDFPVLHVDQVVHRDGAIWPFTVVGRPPQEDTVFGQLIHDLTGPIIPTVIPGVHAVHAVDASGVHPLLLAIGSERYTPYQPASQPAELLTQANAILGQGQMSLAKYLLIVDRQDNPELDIHDVAAFLSHLLERVDWRRDLHFQTCTTIDTLDYSGSGLNEGSKLVIAAAGRRRRELPRSPAFEGVLPDGFHSPRLCAPGVLAIQGPSCAGGNERSELAIERFCNTFRDADPINAYPLIVIVDDSDFAARTLGNFLWVVFTRSNPAADVYGVEAFTSQKHWGCRGSLVIDARIKPHHAPPLAEDPDTNRRVDALAARGGPLAPFL